MFKKESKYKIAAKDDVSWNAWVQFLGDNSRGLHFNTPQAHDWNDKRRQMIIEGKLEDLVKKHITKIGLTWEEIKDDN